MLAKLIERMAEGLQPLAFETYLDLQLVDVRSSASGNDVPVAVLRTPDTGKDVRVFIHLDGGIGDRMSLVKRRHLIAALAVTELIPPSIHVSFSGGAQVFYTGAWRTWVLEELPAWVAERFGVSVEPHNVVLTGISAGGHGALALALAEPERFKAVAAMEPVIMPALHWPQQHTRASWWLLEASARAVWGEPFPESFLRSHPPNIVVSNADRIRASALDIYLEAGDEDLLNLHDGAEYLHRLLWQQDIAHEYHQVRWADHGGRSIDDRFVETLTFLAASLQGHRRESRALALSAAEEKFVSYMLSGGPASGTPMPDDASQGSTQTELTVMARLWEPLKQLAREQDPQMARHYGQLPGLDADPPR